MPEEDSSSEVLHIVLASDENREGRSRIFRVATRPLLGGKFEFGGSRMVAAGQVVLEVRDTATGTPSHRRRVRPVGLYRVESGEYVSLDEPVWPVVLTVSAREVPEMAGVAVEIDDDGILRPTS